MDGWIGGNIIEEGVGQSHDASLKGLCLKICRSWWARSGERAHQERKRIGSIPFSSTESEISPAHFSSFPPFFLPFDGSRAASERESFLAGLAQRKGRNFYDELRPSIEFDMRPPAGSKRAGALLRRPRQIIIIIAASRRRRPLIIGARLAEPSRAELSSVRLG